MSSAGIFTLIESDGVDMRELEALGITVEEHRRTQKVSVHCESAGHGSNRCE